MTIFDIHKSHVGSGPKSRNAPGTRGGTEAMLRDIAFVLKMTQRVKQQIEAAKGAAQRTGGAN
jgi:hypothetical protein